MARIQNRGGGMLAFKEHEVNVALCNIGFKSNFSMHLADELELNAK
jgi:hypothetical protein